MPSFDLWFSYLFLRQPEERKQKKEKMQRFACLDDRELDDLVEGVQTKTTKYATKYAANVFRIIFAFKCYNKILNKTFFIKKHVHETAHQTI